MPHFSDYLKQIARALAEGNATEHTHRPALKALLESLGAGVVATNEPKRVAAGAPDFVVTRGATPLGYVEAKDVGTPLSREEKGEQVARYLELGNLVLTDYLEFRWYVDGKARMTARLAKPAKGGKLRAEPDGAERVAGLLTSFFDARAATVGSAKELAERMARVARLIRSNIHLALAAEDLEDDRADPLHDQLTSFREVLLHDLTPEQFADMYAQTICYGLFAARCNARGSGFTRDAAARLVPKTNPFLQKTFYQMVGPDLSPRVAWAVDDLVSLLAHTDIASILKDFGKRTRREDPVVHFYETFLAEYDPRLRETRGVYYTPEPVVSYIVRSVDHLLKSDFSLAGGLADASKIRVPAREGRGETETHRVLILDPAAGTGTFLFGAINHIYGAVGERAKGAWPAYVAEELLPRLFGFELLMAPYTVAHLKLGLLLQETGVDLARLGDETGGEAGRLGVYLTNTLEEAHQASSVMPFTHWLAEEANAASRIKKDKPVMVVLGNPPYSGESKNPNEASVLINKGARFIQGWEVGRHGKPQPVLKTAQRKMEKKQPTFIGRLMWDYFVVDGERLKERQPKWLNNDYVKFIRFAQYRITQTGYGVLAFITDHGYLSNPTFRGMRQSLMETFDEIYVLDLHGGSLKKELAPGGVKDENVFDIQQGVSIAFFVKHENEKSKPATVRHAHLWGAREIYTKDARGERELSGGKYHWLWHNDMSTTAWTTLEPQSPFYLFIPQDSNEREEYESAWRLTEVLPTNNVGFVSARDFFVVDFDEKELMKRIESFRAPEANISTEAIKEEFGLKDTSSWNVKKARANVRGNKEWKQDFVKCLYRPFDVRPVYYSTDILERPVFQIQRHMLAGFNLGLSTTRSIEIGRGWEHIFCTRHIIQHHTVSIKEVNYLFPLYLYPEQASLYDEPATDAPGGRRANLSEKFVADFAARLGLRFVADGRGDRRETFGPEDVFAYMYAVFHAPAYRSRYSEFLKIDFPRLPLTSDPELFRALADAGDALVRLHLLEGVEPGADFPAAGSHEVEAVRYAAPGEGGHAEGRVWINREQFFAGLAPEVWAFHVGGYQVCRKWLKDRKGRRLTYEEVAHYQRVVAALSETVRLMSEIDAAIEGRGGWPLK